MISKRLIERLEKSANTSCNLSITEDTEFGSLDITNETRDILSLLSDKFWIKDGKNVDITEIFNK